jgi:uncharacterized protein DUF4242
VIVGPKVSMSSFLVEVYTPAAGPGGEVENRIRMASAELTRAGTPVRYVRSIFVPDDELCFYLFEAGSPEPVREASVRAGISAVRIVEAQSTSERRRFRRPSQ